MPTFRHRIAAMASSQLTATRLPFLRTYGRSRRCVFSPSHAKRDLSASHSSFTSSCRRGSTRSTTSPRVSMRILLPTASCTSMDSVFVSSHGRALNAYGLLGQRAHRAKVNDVRGQTRWSAIFRGSFVISICSPRAQRTDILGHPRHFIHEAHTARAMDAARHLPSSPAGPMLFVRLHCAFCSAVTAETRPISPSASSCRSYFAALVAHRAIERVVDEQELHHPSRAFFTIGVLVRHFHPCRLAGSAQLACGLRRPRLHLDEAHAAVTGASFKRSW